MTIPDKLLDNDEIDPIDIVETLAEHYDWDFDRITDDQIAVAIEAVWKTYGVTLSWSSIEEALKLVCSFEMKPPIEKLPNLMETLNLVNNKCWTGSFVYSQELNLMVFRYVLNLSGGAITTPVQINSMVENAVAACEMFYPAFQLTCWGNETPQKSLKVVFGKSYGRA